MPTGYEYQEYKNWRGISKPRRCPFCKKAKGEDTQGSWRLSRVCPIRCKATGDEAVNFGFG